MMALMIMSEWVRSEFSVDTIAIGARRKSYSIRSRRGAIEFRRDSPEVISGETFIDGPNRGEYQYLIRFNSMSFSQYHERRLMEERSADRTIQPTHVSYWFVILPVTLSAAYYLLLPPSTGKKPRQFPQAAD